MGSAVLINNIKNAPMQDAFFSYHYHHISDAYPSPQ